MKNDERITAIRNSIGTIIAHLAILEQGGPDYSCHKADLSKLDYAMYLASKYWCGAEQGETIPQERI